MFTKSSDTGFFSYNNKEGVNSCFRGTNEDLFYSVEINRLVIDNRT